MPYGQFKGMVAWST